MTTDIIYRYKNQVYFNITNKCPCRCTFCIRNTEDAIGEASNLWFEQEPALEEIYKAIDEFDFSDCNEVVFCGYGQNVCFLRHRCTSSGIAWYCWSVWLGTANQ